MKIAISIQQQTLDSPVDPRFGRCAFFAIGDSESDQFEFFKNNNADLGSGAGIQTAQWIADQKVDTILTGRVGPKALEVLKSAGITIIQEVTGTGTEAIALYNKGQLSEVVQAKETRSMETKTKQGASSKRKAAFASESDDKLQAQVSAHFGKCPFYTIIEIEENNPGLVYTLENPYFEQGHQPGQLPNFLHEQGIDVIISGGMGQRAVGFFSQFGIEVITGAEGTVQETLDAYLEGNIEGSAPCNHNHDC